MVLFFRGKFRHVSSSDSDDDGAEDSAGTAAEFPDLIDSDRGVQLMLGAGCLALGALLTLALMGTVIVAQRLQG